MLEHASKTDVETGLKYVNNDACYPAIMTVGQLVEAIKSGRYNPDTTALAISQTGGMCRATNYFALIRKALVDAGYPQIPVATRRSPCSRSPRKVLWTIPASRPQCRCCTVRQSRLSSATFS